MRYNFDEDLCEIRIISARKATGAEANQYREGAYHEEGKHQVAPEYSAIPLSGVMGRCQCPTKLPLFSSPEGYTATMTAYDEEMTP